jgi:hypothetical protein
MVAVLVQEPLVVVMVSASLAVGGVIVGTLYVTLVPGLVPVKVPKLEVQVAETGEVSASVVVELQTEPGRPLMPILPL